LHQGLAFRGHDESVDSTNKGNFRELVQLLADENDKVKKAVGSNAPKNNKMIAPEIQRDIANCFAEVRKGCHIIFVLQTMSSLIVHNDFYLFFADHREIYY